MRGAGADKGQKEFLTGRSIPMLNEFAIHNILVDVDFLEEEFKRNGRPQLMTAFGELREAGCVECVFTIVESRSVE